MGRMADVQLADHLESTLGCLLPTLDASPCSPFLLLLSIAALDKPELCQSPGLFSCKTQHVEFNI